MALPVAQLGTLALKTICKPIANWLKTKANDNAKFRKFIVDIAQANYRFTTRIQRRIYGHNIDAAIRPLDEDKAVQRVANILGQLFVFTVAGTAVTYEVQRNCRAEIKKEELRRHEVNLLRKDMEALKQRNVEIVGVLQERLLDKMEQMLREVEELAREQGLAGVPRFRRPSPPACKDL